MTPLQKLWSDISPEGNYELRDNRGRLIIGWITEDRAKEYQVYYPNSTIEKLKKS